jgi:predicted RNase H-like nuclease (RuvC/YqgF family)
MASQSTVLDKLELENHRLRAKVARLQAQLDAARANTVKRVAAARQREEELQRKIQGATPRSEALEAEVHAMRLQMLKETGSDLIDGALELRRVLDAFLSKDVQDARRLRGLTHVPTDE